MPEDDIKLEQQQDGNESKGFITQEQLTNSLTEFKTDLIKEMQIGISAATNSKKKEITQQLENKLDQTLQQNNDAIQQAIAAFVQPEKPGETVKEPENIPEDNPYAPQFQALLNQQKQQAKELATLRAQAEEERQKREQAEKKAKTEAVKNNFVRLSSELVNHPDQLLRDATATQKVFINDDGQLAMSLDSYDINGEKETVTGKELLNNLLQLEEYKHFKKRIGGGTGVTAGTTETTAKKKEITNAADMLAYIEEGGL